MKRVKAVVFDLGGVLIDWNPRHLYRKLFGGDDAAMERFLAEVCTGDWNLCQDAGRSWAEAVAILQAAHPAQAELIAAFHTRWVEMLAGPIPGTVALLRALKERGLPVYALSNWSSETFPFAQERYDFLTWFDGLVISGHERMVKPELRIYLRLLDRYGLQAPETLFIDDSRPNVAAAAALGFHGHHFVGPAALAAELERLGLIPGH